MSPSLTWDRNSGEMPVWPSTGGGNHAPHSTQRSTLTLRDDSFFVSEGMFFGGFVCRVLHASRSQITGSIKELGNGVLKDP